MVPVGLVLGLRLTKVSPQFLPSNLCEERRPVFVSLAAADKDPALVEVDILDPADSSPSA